jgi:hypothetical protein
MLSLAKQGLTYELAFKILGYLKPLSNETNPSQFFHKRLSTIACSEPDKVTASLIQTAYLRYQGSSFKACKLFFASQSEKLDMLRQWSEENREGASAKTLMHFGI